MLESSGRVRSVSGVCLPVESTLRETGTTKGVLDKTGLAGAYDFGIQFVAPSDQDPAAELAGRCSRIFTAVEQYLGLRLQGPENG